MVIQTVSSSLCTLDGSDYPQFQQSQTVQFPPGPAFENISVNFTTKDDDVVECNETFILTLISLSGDQLQVDPTHNQATITIIDDDGLFQVVNLI